MLPLGALKPHCINVLLNLVELDFPSVAVINVIPLLVFAEECFWYMIMPINVVFASCLEAKEIILLELE